MKIWIVDDDFSSRDKACDAVRQVADRLACDLDVQTFDSLAWPANEQVTRHLPDILILDLVEDGECRGNVFYQALRALEQQNNRLPAFVTIWSGRWDNPQAVEFTDEVVSEDPFVHALEIKNKYELEDAIEGFVKRIRQERPL